MTNAIAIYQVYLDLSSQALWDEDWETLGACMAYPNTISTTDRTVTVDTPEELIEFGQAFRDNLVSLGANAYHRVCRHARFETEDTITGEHVAYALRGATPVVEPFASRMTLIRKGDHWLGLGIDSQARNADVRINMSLPRRPNDPTSPPARSRGPDPWRKQ